MSITLKEYQDVVGDKLDTSAVIDELRKSSVLLDALTFDDTVSPTGSSFTYGYVTVATESGAGVRKVGETYTPSEAKKVKKTADVAILGGKYSIDRAIAKASEKSFLSEVEFQATQKVKGVKAKFNDLLINGDSTSSSGEFDGLAKLLTGASTAFASTVDLTTAAKRTDNAQAFLDEVDEVISSMDGAPTFILMNTKALTIFRSIIRRAGLYTTTKDDMGRVVERYGDAVLVDMGAKAGTSDPVIPTTSNTSAEGKTDIYFVRLGMDGLHGVTLDGQMIDTVTPNFGTVGAEQVDGLVEMYAGVALKSTKAAAVLKGVKIVPKAGA